MVFLIAKGYFFPPFFLPSHSSHLQRRFSRSFNFSFQKSSPTIKVRDERTRKMYKIDRDR